MDLKTNTIYCGDNLEVLSKLPDKSVDLIYADPPFFSNRHYEIIWNDGAEVRAFEDRWQGGIENYLEWMELRLAQCHRVLKDTGSMYLHCDWHANSYLRILMDKIFGYGNLRNEIIWFYNSGSRGKQDFGKRHDTIYRYSKTDEYFFDTTNIREPYSPNINIPESKKHYYNPNGKVVGDVWQMPILSQNDKKERIGYPTQKPEALLKRIIEASSNKDDIVLDPFCGCGTTLSVSQQLVRKWIGIDVSHTACRMMNERLSRIGATDINMVGMPTSTEQLKSMKPFVFQEWIINKIQGTHSNKKSGDGGIDGYTFMSREPVQIKQSEHIGINTVKNFQPSIDAVGKSKGYIIAFSFAKGAYEEVARVREKYDITLVKVDELDQVFNKHN